MPRTPLAANAGAAKHAEATHWRICHFCKRYGWCARWFKSWRCSDCSASNHAAAPILERAELGHLRAKADPIVFHDLRHTFGTLCAANGIDVVSIQVWMGHADLATTRRYMHYAPKHNEAALLTAAFTAEIVAPAPMEVA
jgi:integrase